MQLFSSLTRLCATTALTALFVASPLSLTLDPSGKIQITSAAAFAQDDPFFGAPGGPGFPGGPGTPPDGGPAGPGTPPDGGPAGPGTPPDGGPAGPGTPPDGGTGGTGTPPHGGTGTPPDGGTGGTGTPPDGSTGGTGGNEPPAPPVVEPPAPPVVEPPAPPVVEPPAPPVVEPPAPPVVEPPAPPVAAPPAPPVAAPAPAPNTSTSNDSEPQQQPVAEAPPAQSLPPAAQDAVDFARTLACATACTRTVNQDGDVAVKTSTTTADGTRVETKTELSGNTVSTAVTVGDTTVSGEKTHENRAVAEQATKTAVRAVTRVTIRISGAQWATVISNPQTRAATIVGIKNDLAELLGVAARSIEIISITTG